MATAEQNSYREADRLPGPWAPGHPGMRDLDLELESRALLQGWDTPGPAGGK